MLGHPEGDIGRHQRQRDLDARIARPLAQAQAQPADADAVDDLADDDQAEGPGGLRRARTCRWRPPRPRSGRGSARSRRWRGLRLPAPPRSRRGRPSRRAIASGATTSGGAMMAPSTKPTAQSKSKQIMRGRRHRAGREHHAAEGEQRDRPQVEPELAPAHGDAGRIDQRRQDHQQHQFRRQFDRAAVPAPTPCRCRRSPARSTARC